MRRSEPRRRMDRRRLRTSSGDARTRVVKVLLNGGFQAARWFAREFLALAPATAAESRLAVVSRVLGCAVIAVSLRAELQAGLLPTAPAAAIQLALAALTAVLFGNVAKELGLDLVARLATWRGREFVREGITLGGRTFWEVQFTDGTWARCETEPSRLTCEWTEPDGRCKRLELRAAP